MLARRKPRTASTTPWSLLALLTLLSVPAGRLAADQVTLADGSVVSGTIQSLVDGVLTVAQPAAKSGVVELKIAEVASIQCDGTHTIVLEDGNSLAAQSFSSEGAQFQVNAGAAGTVEIDLARIEAIDPPAKPTGVQHKGDFLLHGRITDGNTRTKAIGAVANYEGRGEDSRLTMRSDWNYAEDGGQLSARNASGAIKYDLFLSRRTFAYANALFQGDDFADLNLRTTLGAGAGYQLFDRDLDATTYSFYEEAGVSFFDEDFSNTKDSRFASARVSGKVDWDIRGDELQFFHFHEVYFGFEDQDDIYASTETGLRAKLWGDLYANAQVNYRWDNTPAPGRLRSDTEYLWGLSYAFRF